MAMAFPFPSQSAAPESWRTSAKATAERRADGFACSACGGAATVGRGRAPACRFAESSAPTPGARTPPTAATIVRSGAPGDRLWRDDPLYDLVIELDHNTRPRIAGRGSAVFIHLAREGFLPTAGCVALRGDDLRRLLPRLRKNAAIEIR
jgi:hypothetical protein